MADAAIDVFTLALRRRMDPSDALLPRLCYERSVVYDLVGRKAQAQLELVSLCVEAPQFEGVQDRPGMELRE